MNEKVKKFFRKFASAHLWLNLLAMVVVVVLLLFGLQWWLLSYTHHGEGIEVPDLYGMDYRKAMDQLEEQGLRIMANDSTYLKAMPAGCIVVQSPAKGMTVKEGRTVYVTINSLTIPRIRIPDLVDNCSYREAQARLQQLEFRLTQPKLIDGEKDWVYGIKMGDRNVRAGELIARESVLTLVIGNGSYGDEYEDEENEFGFDDDDASDGGDAGDDDEDGFVPVLINEED